MDPNTKEPLAISCHQLHYLNVNELCDFLEFASIHLNAQTKKLEELQEEFCYPGEYCERERRIERLTEEVIMWINLFTKAQNQIIIKLNLI